MLTVTEDACEFAGQMLALSNGSEGACVRIDLDKVAKWRSQGAGVSETVRTLIRKAQRQQTA